MIKRIFDCVAASIGLVLLSPVMLAVAVCVKLTSKGPVLFKHRRVGRNFTPFVVYKFRTMCLNAAADGPITWGGRNDPRITSIGRILRLTKLDELPQLMNVVKGEMSLVGPRPEVEEYVELFKDDYREILRFRPGMTDLASLKFYDEASVMARYADPREAYVTRVLPEKIQLAKDYVRRSSVVFDAWLILRTIVSIARRPKAA